MKKALIFFIVIIAFGVLSTACSQKTCPVYTQDTTETSQKAG